MTNERERPDWLIRLGDEIRAAKEDKKRGLSFRKISLRSGDDQGPNFASQLLSGNWREPSFERVVNLCDVLDVSITYIVTGVKMSRYEEEVLTLIAKLSDEAKLSLLAFLRTLSQEP